MHKLSILQRKKRPDSRFSMNITQHFLFITYKEIPRRIQTHIKCIHFSFKKQQDKLVHGNEHMGESGTIRRGEGKPRDSTALPEGASGSIYAVPGSTEGLGAHLKCLYTNTCSISNKQRKLEGFLRPQSYNVVGISETW